MNLSVMGNCSKGVRFVSIFHFAAGTPPVWRIESIPIYILIRHFGEISLILAIVYGGFLSKNILEQKRPRFTRGLFVVFGVLRHSLVKNYLILSYAQ